MCWGRFCCKWPQWSQQCPSTTIIFHKSPALIVSEVACCIFSCKYKMLLWGYVNPKATIKAAALSPPQCLWRTWWRVLRSSFLPSVVWSSAGLTWWTLASVSATARIIGLCFMAWMRSALFLLILFFSGVIWSWVFAMKAFSKHFSIFFFKATACSSGFGSGWRRWKVSRLNIYNGGSLFFHSAILSIIIWKCHALSTYNYVGGHFNQLISAFNAGNLTQARKIQVTFNLVFCFLNHTIAILYQLVPDIFVSCPHSVQAAGASQPCH